MASLPIKDAIKNGLRQKYPLSQLCDTFQQWLDTDEYDTDLIREDILEGEDVLLEYMLSAHPKLDKKELNETLQNLLDTEPNNAEPYPIDDASTHPSLQQTATSSVPHTSIFSPYLYDISNRNINLEEEQERVKELMSSYCPSLLCDEEKGNSYLIFMQTMCFILKKPFNSWIMDMFDRFTIDRGLKPIPPLRFVQMCTTFGQYLTELEDLNVKHAIDFNGMIPHAIQKYKQIRPTLDFNPAHKICDNYYQFVSNVIAINGLISSLITEDSIYPFQFDVWFIPHTMSPFDEEKKQLEDDIEEALLEVETYEEEHYEVNQLEWQQNHKHKTHTFDMNEHSTIMEWMDNMWQDKTIQIKRNMRYVLVIDRRRSDGNDTYCLLHVYQDRIDENTASYCDEEYFEKSKRFIFVTEDEDEDDWGLYDKHPLMFGLSYHVISETSTKMYWNVMDQSIRFKLNDLTNVWPRYFDENLNDLSPSALKGIKKIINESESLKDIEFEQFYECITGGKPCATESYESEEESKSEVSDRIVHCKEQQSPTPPSQIVDIMPQPHASMPACDTSETKLSALLLWLEQCDLTNTFPSYFKLFKKAVTDSFDETDFEIDWVVEELSYFHDEDTNESEILNVMKENEQCNMDEYDEYVEGLIEDVHAYMSMEMEPEPELEPEPKPQMQMMKRRNTNTEKHFVYHCCGECGNGFGQYLFGDVATKKEKLKMFSTYFWSFDYEYRKQLIAVLSESYSVSQSHAVRHLLSELSESSVFVDDDDKWIDLFDDVFKRGNQLESISYVLSQITCSKKDSHLMAELIDNQFESSQIKMLQRNINSVRATPPFHFSTSQAQLSNDELSVLYMIVNRGGFGRLKEQDALRTSCNWKSFYLNAMSALNKLKQYRYHFKVPKDLYHDVSYAGNESDLDINAYLNQITVWYSSKMDTNMMLHLEQDVQKAEIQIIPIEWIVNTHNEEENNIFVILPFGVNPVAPITISEYMIPLSCCQSKDVVAL